jgi:hypothetical protein
LLGPSLSLFTLTVFQLGQLITLWAFMALLIMTCPKGTVTFSQGTRGKWK